MDIETKVQQTKAKADADEHYTNRCLHCNEKVFFVGHTHGLEKGHIYSELGASEYRISRTCEYCFDEITREPEDDLEVGFFGRIIDGDNDGDD